MTKDDKKRKIYRLILYLYGDDANVHIDEYCIKRKGSENISTEEGETLYNFMLDKPSSGTVIGEDSIEVEMVTEDIKDIDKSISLMIEEARSRVAKEIAYFNGMYGQLNQLENFEKEILFKSIKQGFCFIKKDRSDIMIKPFRVDTEPYSIKNYSE